jgi:hypothetical protein
VVLGGIGIGIGIGWYWYCIDVVDIDVIGIDPPSQKSRTPPDKSVNLAPYESESNIYQMKEHKLLHISAYFVWSLTLVKDKLQGTIWHMMV